MRTGAGHDAGLEGGGIALAMEKELWVARQAGADHPLGRSQPLELDLKRAGHLSVGANGRGRNQQSRQHSP